MSIRLGRRRGQRGQSVVEFALIAGAFILIVMGIVLWEGWLVWAMLTFLLGVAHPPPLNDLTPLDPRRRVLGMVVLLIFVLVFVPVPLTVVM